MLATKQVLTRFSELGIAGSSPGACQNGCWVWFCGFLSTRQWLRAEFGETILPLLGIPFARSESQTQGGAVAPRHMCTDNAAIRHLSGSVGLPYATKGARRSGSILPMPLQR
jgi:hypothetical protein